MTSFEPFSLTGRFIRRANASHDVAEILKQQLPAAEYDFLLLPVSDEAHEIFQERLDSMKTDAVLCLGEYLIMPPSAVKVEPYARGRGFDYFRNDRTISSSFAQIVAPDTRSTIGFHYCNAIYRDALNWAEAQENTTPAAFMHIGILGDRNTQACEVRNVLDRLKQQLSLVPNKPVLCPKG